MKLKSVKLAILIGLEYLKRNILIIAGTVLLVAALIIAQVKLNLFYSSNVLRIGFIGTYQEHDLPLEVTRLLSSGLVEASEAGRLKPNLVKGWEVNNDATEFTFKLKDNLVWADNTKIKAADLKVEIPNTVLTIVNDNTFKYKLKESYSPLPSLLTLPLFQKGKLVGVGPYKVTKIEKSRIFITKMILEPINPSLPVLNIRFYPNEKVAITGFNLGEVQVLMGVNNTAVFADNPLTLTKAKTDYSKIVTVLFRTSDNLLKSRSLRQALAYQTPKIVGEVEANNPYTPGFWAYDKEAKKYLDNPDEAEEALERAKSQVSEDMLKGELILTSTPNLKEVAKKITDAWKKLGFDAKVRVESGIPQNFHALLITQSIPLDADQYFLWHATQSKTNLSKYDSKRVDKDLEDGRKIISENDRIVKYFDFQKTLLEDAPAVFLYFPKYNIVYLKKASLLLDQVLKI